MTARGVDVAERLPFPLSRRPQCVKRPDLECLDECEYGIAGPCLRGLVDEPGMTARGVARLATGAQNSCAAPAVTESGAEFVSTGLGAVQPNREATPPILHPYGRNARGASHGNLTAHIGASHDR
jgi:hypothetical protein